MKTKNLIFTFVSVVLVSFCSCSKEIMDVAVPNSSTFLDKAGIMNPEYYRARIYENCAMKDGMIVIAVSKRVFVKKGFPIEDYERLKQNLVILNKREESHRQSILLREKSSPHSKSFAEEQEEYFLKKKFSFNETSRMPEAINAQSFETCNVINGKIELVADKEEWLKKGYREEDYESLKQDLPALNAREENIRKWVLFSGKPLPIGWESFQEQQDEYFSLPAKPAMQRVKSENESPKGIPKTAAKLPGKYNLDSYEFLDLTNDLSHRYGTGYEIYLTTERNVNGSFTGYYFVYLLVKEG